MEAEKPLPEPEWFTHSTIIKGVRVDVSVETSPKLSRLHPKTWDTFSMVFTPLDDPELTHNDVVKNCDAYDLQRELEYALKRDIPQLRNLSKRENNERYWARGGFGSHGSELVLRIPPCIALPWQKKNALRLASDDCYRVLETITKRLDQLLERHGPLAPSRKLREIERAEGASLGTEAFWISQVAESAPRKIRREIDGMIDQFNERVMSIKSATGRAYYAQWPDGNHELKGNCNGKVANER